MVPGPITTAISIALPVLKLSHASMIKVNKQCLEKDLPPAFEFGSSTEENNPIDLPIHGNPDYRFAGFGIVAGLPPRLSFWVHYKPDSSDHVEVGKVLVPIELDEAFNLPSILAKI